MVTGGHGKCGFLQQQTLLRHLMHMVRNTKRGRAGFRSQRSQYVVLFMSHAAVIAVWSFSRKKQTFRERKVSLEHTSVLFTEIQRVLLTFLVGCTLHVLTRGRGPELQPATRGRSVMSSIFTHSRRFPEQSWSPCHAVAAQSRLSCGASSFPVRRPLSRQTPPLAMITVLFCRLTFESR